MNAVTVNESDTILTNRILIPSRFSHKFHRQNSRNRIMNKLLATTILTIIAAAFPAQAASGCEALPRHSALKLALKDATSRNNGGLGLNMWGTVVDRSGVVCAIVYTGENEGSQWPGSRVISAQKASTANAFSLKELALSTANLYSAVQPGGSLFGLQESNPVNPDIAYDGNAHRFGRESDPMVGQRIGGVNVFGGGLALYNDKGEIIGGLGVSGDTSCADHNIAWQTRQALSLDYVPAGVSPDKNDQIIYDIRNGKSASGYGHPTCGGTEDKLVSSLDKTRRIETVTEEKADGNSGNEKRQ